MPAVKDTVACDGNIRASFVQDRPESGTKEHQFAAVYIEQRLRGLLGDMFVILDGSIPNRDQNRALKKMMSEKFTKLSRDFYSIADPSNDESGAAMTPLFEG